MVTSFHRLRESRLDVGGSSSKICNMKMRLRLLLLVGFLGGNIASAQAPSSESRVTHLERFKPLAAPKPAGLLLKKGDRLAICGDSITEQKMYSRVMEDYLTMCVPELEVTVRQYGWGRGEGAGFLARLGHDWLGFPPDHVPARY